MPQTMLMDSSGELTQDRFAIRETFLPKGHHCTLHWHDYFEFEIVLSGRGEHIHNDASYPLTPGGAYLMSYYDFHSLRAVTDMRLLNLRFVQEVLPQELAGFLAVGGRQFRCSFTWEETGHIRRMLERLAQEKTRPQPFGETLCTGLLSELVIQMIRKSDCGGSALTPTLVQRVITRVYQEFRAPLTLTALAKELSVSVNYLGSLFQETTGVSFREYLNTIRLKYACKLLVSSSLSVKEIAFEAGYNSVEYFLCAFKKRLGLTPTAYRRAAAGGNR